MKSGEHTPWPLPSQHSAPFTAKGISVGTPPPLLINIRTCVTRPLTFIITILFPLLCPLTRAPSWSPSCANNLSLASLLYSLVRRSYRRSSRCLDIQHHTDDYRWGLKAPKTWGGGELIDKWYRSLAPDMDARKKMHNKDVMFRLQETYIITRHAQGNKWLFHTLNYLLKTHVTKFEEFWKHPQNDVDAYLWNVSSHTR